MFTAEFWIVLWGFLGAALYASGVLSLCLWASETPPRGRALALCWAQFVRSTAFGTAAASAFAVTAHHFVGWAEMRAMAFVIGSTINEGWPFVQKRIIEKVARLVDKVFGS